MSRVWRSRALTLLGLWLGVCAVVSIFGARPSYGLVALVVAAGGAVVLLFLDASARNEPAVWRLPGEEPVTQPGEDPRFALLRRVVAGHLDAHHVDGTLHTQLVALADQRLLAHHGVHRLADPERRDRADGTRARRLRRRDPTAPPPGPPGDRRTHRPNRGPVSDHPDVLDLDEVSRRAEAVLDEVQRAVVGKRAELTLVLAAVLAGGHVLIEDFPGLGKTLAARSFAQTLGLEFTRAQFTPDLLPADLTGSFVYDQKRSEFDFRPGPLFTGLLLADEINRTPPKTQAALLEAMQERQVTVEGQTFPLAAPFHVLATSNPVEYEGTYPLPEAQLDRFLMRVSFGYPTRDQEWDVLARRLDRRREEQTLDPVTDAAGLLAMQAAVETVAVEESVGRYCVALAAGTRDHPQVLMGSSPRGALALMLTARAVAVISGRDYVVPEDVKTVAPAVLAHRITVKPELWMSDVTGAGVVRSVLAQVETPSARERHR